MENNSRNIIQYIFNMILQEKCVYYFEKYVNIENKN